MQGSGRLHVGAQQLLDRLLLFALSQLTGDWSSASPACLPLLMLRFPCATPACCLSPQVTSRYEILHHISIHFASFFAVIPNLIWPLRSCAAAYVCRP